FLFVQGADGIRDDLVTGVSDVCSSDLAPFRRLTAALGAGLVVSEMTASDDLVHGRPMSQLRCEATGIGPHVVQLAGCEVRWMARSEERRVRKGCMWWGGV